MKTHIYMLLLVAAVFFSSCKKSPTVSEVDPLKELSEFNADGTRKYLKNITVPGAEKILYDSSTYDFVINLPKNFAAKDIDLKLSLYKDIRLEEGTPTATGDTIIKFVFQGSAPLHFTLLDPDGKKRIYTVYVDHLGAAEIELSASEIQINSGSIQLPIKIINGIGTTPSTPSQKNPSVKFIDRKTNAVTEGIFYNNLAQIYIENAAKLINSEKLALEVQFDDQKPFVFENIKFKRGLPNATIACFDHLVIPQKDTILVLGGYYSPAAKYRYDLSSDFQSKIVSENMTFLDSSRIRAVAPAGISDGSYLITFFENDKVIGKSSLYFAQSKTNSIETIWKGTADLAFVRNTNKLSFAKGDNIYAKPWPPKYAGSGSTFDVKDVPDLRLKNGTTIMDLKPQLTVINWAVAGVSYSIGKYTIPANIQAGSYEATLVFPDKQESKPYWSKMEIR